LHKKLYLNSLSGTALYVVNIAVAFVLSPVLLKALGNNGYGLWELIMSVVGYMGLLDLGIGSAMVRYVAVAEGSQDREELGRLISTSLVFFSTVGGIACVLFMLMGFFPGFLAGEDAGKIENIHILFYIFALNALFTFPMQVFLSVLLGLQCHYFINFTRIILILVKSIIIYFYIFSYSASVLVFISVVEIVYTIITFFLFYLFMSFKRDIPKFSLGQVSRENFHDLFVFGSKNLVMMAASRLQNQSIPLIIANVIGMGSIVYYAFPNRLVEYAKGFSLAIGYPLTPYFGSVIGRGQSEGLKRAWLDVTFILQAIMFIIPVVLFYYGEIFLNLWIGQEYGLTGRWVLRILIIGLVADTLAVNGFRILTAQANHGKCAFVWLLLAALSIPAGVLGGKMWGVAGVALGVVLASVIGNLVTVTLACASLRITLGEYLRGTCVKLLPPLILINAYCGLLPFISDVTGFLTLSLHVASVVLLYGALLWMCSIDRTVKVKIKEMIHANIINKNSRT